MKKFIPILAISLQSCSPKNATYPEQGEGYLLTSRDINFLVLKSNRYSFIVGDFPDGFSPLTPDIHDGSCIFIANEVAFEGKTEPKTHRIILSKVRLLRRASPNDIGQVTPSFRTSMVC